MGPESGGSLLNKNYTKMAELPKDIDPERSSAILFLAGIKAMPEKGVADITGCELVKLELLPRI